jgi:hypothetical protein
VKEKVRKGFERARKRKLDRVKNKEKVVQRKIEIESGKEKKERK